MFEYPPSKLDCRRTPQIDWIQQRSGDLNPGRISSNWVARPMLAAMLCEFSLNK